MDIISPSVSPKIINNAFTTAAVSGATLVNGTGTATGSPITLANGVNTIPITGAGNFVVTLPVGCNGTAVSGTATVTGSPQTLVPGANTVVVGAGGLPGTITVNLAVDNNLVTIPRIQVGYVTRLAVNNPTGGNANLVVQDVYTPDVSVGNPTPTLQVKNRYSVYITASDFIDINGHKISKHMGLLRITSDTAGVVVSYTLELE